MPPPLWMRMAVPPPGYDPRAEEAGWEHVLHAAVEQVPADVPVTTRLARAAPAEAIVKRAAEGCHDLVVLGCEGRGPLRGLIGGGVRGRGVRGGSPPRAPPPPAVPVRGAPSEPPPPPAPPAVTRTASASS